MNKYKTNNIWIASALVSSGYQAKVEQEGYLKNGNTRYVYVFDETDELKEILYKMSNKNLPIDVETFRENYLILKNLCYNNEQQL